MLQMVRYLLKGDFICCKKALFVAEESICCKEHTTMGYFIYLFLLLLRAVYLFRFELSQIMFWRQVYLHIPRSNSSPVVFREAWEFESYLSRRCADKFEFRILGCFCYFIFFNYYFYFVVVFFSIRGVFFLV